MSSQYSNYGGWFWNVPIIDDDGSAPDAADTDGLKVAFLPTAGVLQTSGVDFSLLTTTLACERNITVGVVDADASITYGRIFITGKDRFGRSVQEEILLTSAGGTLNYTGHVMFKDTIVISVVQVGGAAPDTIQFGWGDEIGLPYDIGATSDIKIRRMDTTTGAGTLDAAKRSLILAGGEIPNGTRQYTVSGASTA